MQSTAMHEAAGTDLRKYSFTTRGLTVPLRLDRAIPQFLPAISRQQARKLITIGAAWINGARVQVQSRMIENSDDVLIYRGREGWKTFYETAPQNILHEDDWLLFYCKESGIPTQGIFCDNYNNLYAGLLRMLKKRRPVPYLGLHHRLDIDTTGVVLFAKDKKANRSIHYQFKNRSVQKSYLVLTRGTPDFTEREFSACISKSEGKYYCSENGPGKPATTAFQKLRDFSGYSLLRAFPHTGRTHQIRLHLAALGHPVLGDPLYGGNTDSAYARTMLHAESLTIAHPRTRQELTVTATPPADMQGLIAPPA